MSTAKAEYAKSLRKLEEISESIHAARKFKKRLQEREPGVGADLEAADLHFDLDLDMNERASVVSGKSSSVDEPDYENDSADSAFKRTLSCPDSIMLKDLSLKEKSQNPQNQ